MIPSSDLIPPPRPMFQLTRQERILVIGILLAFVTGLVVKHVRSRDTFPPTASPAHSQNADQ